MTSPPSTLVPVLLVGFVAWRMFSRVRKNIGRQPVQTKRMVARIVIFAVVAFLMGAASYLQGHSWLSHSSLSFGGGLALGIPLALVGLHLTRFEETPEGHFYTPNLFIGIGLSALLVGRLVFRMFRLYSMSETTGVPYAGMAQSNLTLFLFGVVASYYIAYFSGVLIRAHGLLPVKK